MKKPSSRSFRKLILVAAYLHVPLLWGVAGFTYATNEVEAQVVYALNKTGTQSAAQQNEEVTVQGVITDQNGEVIIGASILVKGTDVGVATGLNGQYVLRVPNENSTIIVSYIGCVTQEIVIGNRRQIDVELHETSLDLEEVTIVAYGAQKKATLTGAIASVSTDALLKSPAASVTNSLAGQLTGVSTLQSSGQPGADGAQIFVRGIGSLSENSGAPLILVDGVERSFTQMDPNEIGSITVLKDASATAVFGVRGANGVILVTTRRGAEGKARISFSSNVGVQTPTRILETADSYTTGMVYNDAQRNGGTTEDQLAFSPYVLERFRLGDQPGIYPDINWYDYLMNDASVQTQHNINISGGTKKVRYFISAGHLYQDGLFKQLEGLDYNNNYNYSRFNYRANLDVNLTKSTILKFNMGGIVGKTHEPASGANSVWKQLSWSHPFSSPGIIDGKKIITTPSRYGTFKMENQVIDRYYGDGYKRRLTNKMNFDLHLEQKLDFITKGLSLELKGSYNTDYWYEKTAKPSKQTYTAFYKSEIDGLGVTDVTDPNFDKTVVYRVTGEDMMTAYSDGGNTDRARDWYIEGSLRYQREFGDHNISALLLYNQNKIYYPGGVYDEVSTAYLGLVGRVTYDYQSKYIAEFNVGYNGSENFAPGKRFGVFPAGSIGYIITQEDFFPKNDYLTYLKIRASVGMVGNDNMSSNRFMYLPGSYAINQSGTINSLYQDKYGYVFGLTNTVLNPVSYELSMGNPEVTWEKALKQNYGVDMALLSDRLKISADYFREHRRDILIKRNTVPSLSAISSILPIVNMGEVQNQGYEVEVKWRDKLEDFSYFVNANVSYARNKILFMDEIPRNEKYSLKTGHEVGARFGRMSDGFYAENDFNIDGTLRNDLPQPQEQVFPGDIKYKDLNGDMVINSDDETKIGLPKRPLYTFGLNLGVEYKGVFLSTNWTAVTGTRIYLSNAFQQPFMGEGGALYQYYADNRWTPETAATATFPRTTLTTTFPPTSDVYQRDASYIKLKNLTFGYSIQNKKFLQAIGASTFSLKFTGYNLLTFDYLKVFDPEGELTRDKNTYPITKIFNFGINVTF